MALLISSHDLRKSRGSRPSSAPGPENRGDGATTWLLYEVVVERSMAKAAALPPPAIAECGCPFIIGEVKAKPPLLLGAVGGPSCAAAYKLPLREGCCP